MRATKILLGKGIFGKNADQLHQGEYTNLREPISSTLTSHLSTISSVLPVSVCFSYQSNFLPLWTQSMQKWLEEGMPISLMLQYLSLFFFLSHRLPTKANKDHIASICSVLENVMRNYDIGNCGLLVKKIVGFMLANSGDDGITTCKNVFLSVMGKRFRNKYVPFSNFCELFR